MKAMYHTIDNGQIGLFESPTGTGKTLSIICSTLTWLSHNRIPTATITSSTSTSTSTVTRATDAHDDDADDNEDPPWVAEQVEQRHERQVREVIRRRARVYDLRVRSVSERLVSPSMRKPRQQRLLNHHDDGNNGTSQLDDLFGDLSSDSDGEKDGKTKKQQKNKNKWKNKNRHHDVDIDDGDVFQRFNNNRNDNDNADDDDEKRIRSSRIIFATRTHTQITQFIQELRRTSFCPPSLSQALTLQDQNHNPNDNNNNNDNDIYKMPPISVTVFGSRKQMCINDSVRSLSSATAISERCRDLTDSSTTITTTTTTPPTSNSTSTSTLTKKRTRTPATRCQFHDTDAENQLRDTVLVDSASDIEDIVRDARRIGGCPYFATRDAISSGMSDVVVVPYAAVLHSATRHSLGLHIDADTIVVFDEAHNVASAVRDMHSCVVTGGGLRVVVQAVESYLKAFTQRLSADNLFRIRQMLRMARGLCEVVVKTSATNSCVNEQKGKRDGINENEKENERVVKAEDLVFEACVDNVNIVELVAYIRDSRLCKKLRGYVCYSDNEHDNGSSKRQNKKSNNDHIHNGHVLSKYKTSTVTNSNEKQQQQQPENHKIMRKEEAGQHLDNFERFLTCLCDVGEYGRVAIYPENRNRSCNNKNAKQQQGPPRLRYFVVEASALFHKALNEARSILLLGGTLSPREALTGGLLRDMIQSRSNTNKNKTQNEKALVEFECDHVVPAENVMTRVCTRGVSGHAFEFTHRNRTDTVMVEELWKCVLSVARISRGGIVIFFASYDLLEHCVGNSPKQVSEVSQQKSVFRESKQQTSPEGGGRSVWELYQEEVFKNRTKGAVLLAVMGGKLSEGMNFSDDLGRVVMMVGMPFANARNIETAQVLKSLRDSASTAAGGMPKDYLENECMTVVNQCVGRAVRHRDDYACVLLMDGRYARDRVQYKMPKFLKRDLQVRHKMDDVCHDMTQFFHSHFVQARELSA